MESVKNSQKNKRRDLIGLCPMCKATHIINHICIVPRSLWSWIQIKGWTGKWVWKLKWHDNGFPQKSKQNWDSIPHIFAKKTKCKKLKKVKKKKKSK